MKELKEKIFKSVHATILKRAFSIDGDGMCVRTEVAEKCIKEAIDLCIKELIPEKQYDFWGQPVS
jgi:hypothetical protein